MAGTARRATQVDRGQVEHFEFGPLVTIGGVANVTPMAAVITSLVLVLLAVPATERIADHRRGAVHDSRRPVR